MARIEHIALWVDDLDALSAFYANAFGAQVAPRYVNAAKGFESCFLTFESGARVELMTTTRLSPARHAAGVERMGPRRTGDGYYESVVLDPEGNRIEITA